MGLITGLFTWPVAPVRGVAWIADQVLDEAERQWADPAAVERALAEVDAKRQSGELSDQEAAELEEELVARLIHDRGDPHG
jgi:gas vesicle protein GvpG